MIEDKLFFILISHTYEGKIHDKYICDKENLSYPQNINLWVDGGFLGYKPRNAGVMMSARKSRGKKTY